MLRDAVLGHPLTLKPNPADAVFGYALTLNPTPPDAVFVGAAGMSPGKGYVDVSTIDPASAQKVAAAVRAKGGLFLEAPVSGSKGPAEQGQLIFLTAGT